VREDRLDLLRRLTAAAPHWALVKNDASALDGSGDVDSAAPAPEWPALVAAASDWAHATNRGPVLKCRHIEGTLIVVVVEPGTPALLEQIDILDHRLLHGTPLARAADLTADATLLPDGYRRVAPWAESVARLVPDASLELRTLAGAFAHPLATARRVAAAPARRRCPILRALREGRRVPGDLDEWLVEVGRTHSYR